MQNAIDFLKTLKGYLEISIFKAGDISISPWLILYFAVSVFLLFYLSAKLKSLLVNRLFFNYIINKGVRQAIASIIRYAIVFFGLIIIMQSAGIDLTSLTLLAGALGVGIGFGLQNITNNLVSGLIILFERPIKEGDRIEIGNTHGMVMRISLRATTILTNDNIAIIVPNSDFISKEVINWSYSDDKVRFRIPILVAHGSDLRLVEKLLLEVADENKNVMKYPAPTVRVARFAENGIEMQLLPWTNTMVQTRGKFQSDLNFAIDEKFRTNHIVIPLPQRDLHLKSGFQLGN